MRVGVAQRFQVRTAWSPCPQVVEGWCGKARGVREEKKAGDEGAPVTGAYLYHLVRVYLCTKRRTRPAVHVVMYIYVP